MDFINNNNIFIMEKLEGWVFIYNPHIKKWQATERENAHLLYNDFQNSLVLKSSKIETLQEVILRKESITIIEEKL